MHKTDTSFSATAESIPPSIRSVQAPSYCISMAFTKDTYEQIKSCSSQTWQQVCVCGRGEGGQPLATLWPLPGNTKKWSHVSLEIIRNFMVKPLSFQRFLERAENFFPRCYFMPLVWGMACYQQENGITRLYYICTAKTSDGVGWFVAA